MDGTLASPVDLKDLCGFPLNPKDLLCFQQSPLLLTEIAQILPSDLKTAPDLLDSAQWRGVRHRQSFKSVTVSRSGPFFTSLCVTRFRFNIVEITVPSKHLPCNLLIL